MDTNNNLVGYDYTKNHQSLNIRQLCDRVREKVEHIRKAQFADEADSITVPPNHLRSRLIYIFDYLGGVKQPELTLAGFYPRYHPCTAALTNYPGLTG